MSTLLEKGDTKTQGKEEEFLQDLYLLAEKNKGDLAILKRNVGNTIAESHGASKSFYSILPYGVPENKEEIFFLVSTLYGHNKYPHAGDFGKTMRRIRDKKIKNGGSPDSLDRRMAVLLDNDFNYAEGYPAGGELPYRLRQCVKLANNSEVGVDWSKLLHDLLQWSHPDKYVQKRWAKSYFGHEKKPGNVNDINTIIKEETENAD